MNDVEFRKIKLNKMDINHLFDIIENILNECKDSQIFISKSVYKDLIKNSPNKICSEYVIDSIQYGDNVEKSFVLSKDKENGGLITFKMNFVSNSKNFEQLTYFSTKGVNYFHYLTEMKYIYLITD